MFTPHYLPCGFRKQPHILGMEISYRIRENWLTRKPRAGAWTVTLVLFFLLFGAQALGEINFAGLRSLMVASGEAVFERHEYWRLWTALFAHADFGHIASNSMLFFPFAYYLYGYYGFRFFPLFGIFSGGIINFFVLMNMAPQTGLLGISGVVYWMGAAWLTLFLLIDRRGRLRVRISKVALLSALLFLPETYRPEVSYLSHFLGYLLGVLSGVGFFWLHRDRFRAAEVVEEIRDEEDPPVSGTFHELTSVSGADKIGDKI